jgi:hypothetical protein
MTFRANEEVKFYAVVPLVSKHKCNTDKQNRQYEKSTYVDMDITTEYSKTSL